MTLSLLFSSLSSHVQNTPISTPQRLPFWLITPSRHSRNLSNHRRRPSTSIATYPHSIRRPIPSLLRKPASLTFQTSSRPLTQLLGAMSGNNMPQNQQPTPNFNADLARLLAQVSSPAQTPSFGTTAHPQMPQLGHFPGLASLLANQAQSAPPPVQNAPPAGGAPPDMSEIMAQLAQYQR
jgi:hypothetical protein